MQDLKQEMVPELFVKIMNLISVDGKLKLLKKVNEYNKPVSSKKLLKEFLSDYPTLRGSVNEYVKSLVDNKLVSEVQDKVYVTESLGVTILNVIKKYPHILTLRSDNTSYNSSCNEEKILLYLLQEGKKSSYELNSVLNSSNSVLIRTLKRLNDKGMIRKAAYNLQYAKRDREVNSNTLNEKEKFVIEALDDNYKRIKEIRDEFKSRWEGRSFRKTLDSLTKKEIISLKSGVTEFDLTRKGKTTAQALYKILETVKQIPEAKSRNSESMIENRNKTWQEQLSEAFEKVFNSN